MLEIDNKIDEFKKRRLREIVGMVSKLDNIDSKYIKEGYTLKGDTLKEVLETLKKLNIPLPTNEQKASWSRPEGVSIKKISEYMSNHQKENYFLTGQM